MIVLRCLGLLILLLVVVLPSLVVIGVGFLAGFIYNQVAWGWLMGRSYAGTLMNWLLR